MSDKYETAARIESASSKPILVAMFWAWGVIGLVGLLVAIATLPSGVGIGTSGYLTMCAVVWMGGLVLFGLGSLLPKTVLEFKRPAS
jgi:hypothetical protein